MTNSALFMAVFLACAVEAVEALTIVLAAGMARDWRSSITGVLAGMVTLAAVVALLGPALSAIPLDAAVRRRLLLVFGLQWLRKAILRASGHKALPTWATRSSSDMPRSMSDTHHNPLTPTPDWSLAISRRRHHW